VGDISELYNGAILAAEPVLEEAKVKDNATGPKDEVRVIIPGVDPHQATDPMQWMPVVTGDGVFYPKVGDRAVVAHPEGGPPFITFWQPKAESPDHAL
jgi:hypothetical protein